MDQIEAIYERQRAYWRGQSPVMLATNNRLGYFESEFTRIFASATLAPDQALGELAAICPLLLELAQSADPAYVVGRKN